MFNFTQRIAAMNYKNMSIFMTMIITLPSVIHGMNMVLSKKNIFSQKSFNRLFYGSADELRTKIATPRFNLSETDNIIKKMEKPNKCGGSGFVEYTVYKATEHKKHEKKYAGVLKQIRNQGWGNTCCVNVQLHSAVISDLPHVTEELLNHDKNWIDRTDFHGCIPLHYAQSPRIAKMLLAKGSQINARDKWNNTPLHLVPGKIVPLLIAAESNILKQHDMLRAENDMFLRINGWYGVTPLRKAVDEGDIDKYFELVNPDIAGFVTRETELNILIMLANLKFWRTNDSKFSQIEDFLSTYRRHHYYEKH